jgi:hypothetical protein
MRTMTTNALKDVAQKKVDNAIIYFMDENTLGKNRRDELEAMQILIAELLRGAAKVTRQWLPGISLPEFLRLAEKIFEHSAPDKKGSTKFVLE